MNASFFNMGRLVCFVALGLIAACQTTTPEDSAVSKPTNSDSGSRPGQLTNEALYKNWEYNAQRPGVIRWQKDGANYTTLETASGYEDAKLEKDRYGDDIKIYEEVVEYNPTTNSRRIVVSLNQLTPKGSDKPLKIDDYNWSKDKSKLLIFTNAEYVWRHKDRGDYWVRDQNTESFWQLGGSYSAPGEMMFGKFSPNGLQFAYVWQDNILSLIHI